MDLKPRPDSNGSYFHGVIYRHFIDPALIPIRKRVRQWIPEEATVLDIGCGTGAQLFALSDSISRGLGIDLSNTQIEHANRRAREAGLGNLEFWATDASRLVKLGDREFDFAVASLVIHEMPAGIRLMVLREMARVAKQLILVDWEHRQRNPWRTFNVNLIEFLAGFQHYRGFRSFIRNGGMTKLLDQASLSIDAEQETSKGTMHLWLCS